MKTLLIAFILVFTGWSSAADLKPRTVSSDTDGIVIAVTARKESSGKTLIACNLTNHSQHILATGVPISKSLCFRFSLRSVTGEAIPLDSKWGLVHQQPDASNSSPMTGLARSVLFIRPGQSREFQFYLEDAFGDRSDNGKELEVRWLNFYNMPGGMVEIDELKHLDGTVIPAYQEMNHFPGRRVFVVTLPLTDDTTATQPETPATTPDNGEAIPDAQLASRGQTQDNGRSLSSEPFDLRWLLLLLLPGIAWMLRSIRWRGKF